MSLNDVSKSHYPWMVCLLLFAVGTCLQWQWHPIDFQEFSINTIYGPTSFSPFCDWFDHLAPNTWTFGLLYALLIALNLLMLNHLVTRFELIGSLSLFPLGFYLVFMTARLPQNSPSLLLTSFLLMVTTEKLLSCHRENDCNRQVFGGFFCYACACLLLPALLWVLPVIWILFNQINSLTLPRFFSSLLAFLCLAWLVGGSLFLFDSLPVLNIWLMGLVDQVSVGIQAKLAEWVFLGMTAVLFLVSAIHFLQHRNQDRNHVRVFLYFLISLWICDVVMGVVFSSMSEWFLCLSFVPLSVFCGKMYDRCDNLMTRLLLFLTLLSSVWCFLS